MAPGPVGTELHGPTGPGFQAEEFLRHAIEDLPANVCPSLHAGPVWLSVTPPGAPLPEAGWKLHISARRGNFRQVAERAVPLLLAEGCAFKLAGSETTLTDLNEGLSAAAQVGKAITVYPDQSRVEYVGRLLCDVLTGMEGPRILSDRRIAGDAPVYYRYGPFRSRWFAGDRGGLSLMLHGPAGESFEAAATMEYRQPSWVCDPFGSDDPEADTVLGGRYRVDEGIYKAAKGNVYRGVDLATGRRVVVKQARAFVSESTDGADARSRLRNERRILTALDSMPGVPAFVDHFAHGDDEFLVTTDVGQTNLLDHAVLSGSYRPAPESAENAAAGERFLDLATSLATIVRDLHHRGVVMSDLTPRNVVMTGETPAVIDFGISALDGFTLPGGTPGFAPWRQSHGGEPAAYDDCHALGMTLGFAATGLTPVAARVGPGVPAERMLGSVVAVHGPDSIQAAVVGALIDEDSAVPALADLAAGTAPKPTQPRRSGLPAVTDADVEALIPLVINQILDQLDDRVFADRSGYSAVDTSIYTGSAGIGLELLHHLDHPRSKEAVRKLLTHTVAALNRVDIMPGLYVGLTGVELFVRRAAELGLETTGIGELPHRGDGGGDDLMYGSAGAGVGHLLLHALTGDPARLDLAGERVQVLLGKARPELIERDADIPDEAAIDAPFGYAHGWSGVIELLRAFVVATGDDRAAEALERTVHKVAARTGALAAQAKQPVALPMSVSWCQGLAGMAPALHRAADVVSDPQLARLAERAAASAAESAAHWIPRLDNTIRCCGVAGAGELFADLWLATDDERYRASAYAAVGQLLLRNQGPEDAPVFVALDRDAPLSWGMGSAGVLTFLRRLHTGTGFDLVP
ncbi:lanthionine synthetase LanC family protein [Kribbella sp. NPDC048928]|uniref:class III lanthionine synthetase LanKC N-terminal domain-containing protein n=1 Tax=Kribbella sp. NPDC048928 TaxID=3364111 RepID=UPI00371FC737